MKAQIITLLATTLFLTATLTTAHGNSPAENKQEIAVEKSKSESESESASESESESKSNSSQNHSNYYS